MSQSTREVTLKVVGQVALGSNKFLPPDIYPGWIVTNHIMLRGRQINQIAKVVIPLSEEQIASFLGRDPSPTRLGMDCDFTADYTKGNIIEVS